MKSKSNKKSKPSKKATKTPKASYKHMDTKLAKRPSIIENLPPPPETMSHATDMDFDDVYMVFDALYGAFHHDTELPEGDVDNRFVALWTLFLASVGWSEDLFWNTLDGHEHTCPECRKEQEEARAAEKILPSSDPKDKAEEAPAVKIKTLPPGKQFN